MSSGLNEKTVLRQKLISGIGDRHLFSLRGKKVPVADFTCYNAAR
jgi:hypothetical protein